MAADTIGRQSLAVELPDAPALVTGVAIHGSVRTDQGKTVLVLVDIVDRNLPARNSVAQVALSSVFPAVDVGVTILAGVANLGENPLDVAFLARHLRVHATEREAGLLVIKFGIAANGHPCICGVTVLTGQVQWTMGIPSGGGRGGLRRGRSSKRREENKYRLQQHLSPQQDSPLYYSVIIRN